MRSPLRHQPVPAPLPPPVGLYLGWGSGGPVLAGPEQHALVLGPPRSGKTSRLIGPAIARHHGPAVVTSTKPDVIAATIAWRARAGRCWYWDPSNTTPPPVGLTQLRWSPITGCGQWDHAVTRAHALAGAGRPVQTAYDTHWVERAQALLAPLLQAAALSGADMATLLSWLQRRAFDPPLAELTKRDARRACDVLAGMRQTDSRELSGILSTADGLLAAYRTDAALAATRQPNFDPAAFAAGTDTIYLVSPAVNQEQHASIVVALLEQIRTATYTRRPRPPMGYFLDEMANIAPLPELPGILAEGGSQGLVVMASLQDLSQARNRWGKAADGFLTLFTHKLILGGVADTATLKAVSLLAGEIDVPVPTNSQGWATTPGSRRSRQKHTSWTTRRQPRLAPDQVSNLPPGRGILITGTALRQVSM